MLKEALTDKIVGTGWNPVSGKGRFFSLKDLLRKIILAFLKMVKRQLKMWVSSKAHKLNV